MDSEDNNQERKISTEEDRKWVLLCQQGDLLAFDALITKYRTRMFSMIFSIVRNEQDAWDISQDGFIRAWKAIGRFRDESSFSTWLHRIMTNAALDWLRRAKNRRTTFFDEAFPAPDADGDESGPSQGDSAPEVLRRQEMRERINAAIENLSPEHRAVILLKEVEGLQYNEIGNRLMISIGTVMSRLFYARKSLQKQLKDLHEDR